MAYHALTTEQMKNLEGANEICDFPLVPQWQRQFVAKAIEMLEKLEQFSKQKKQENGAFPIYAKPVTDTLELLFGLAFGEE